MYTDIILEKRGAAAYITLNKPQVKNAMGKQTLIEIAAALDDIGKESSIVVAVIKGAGGTFCSGMDTRERAGPTGGDAEAFTQIADRMFLAVDKCKKVTIAMVNGYCIAGGFELALCCDFIIADENSRIGDGHIKLAGFVPNAGSSIRLPKLIGARKAKEILFTGDLISGKDAERMGIVNCAAPADKLESKVAELVAKLADKSPIGLEYMKMLVDSAMDSSLQDGMLRERAAVKFLGTTEDHHEAVTAAKEKRKPVYKGK